MFTTQKFQMARVLSAAITVFSMILLFGTGAYAEPKLSTQTCQVDSTGHPSASECIPDYPATIDGGGNPVCTPPYSPIKDGSNWICAPTQPPINNCENVTFRVSIINSGDQDAVNLNISNTMPAGFSPTTLSSNGNTVPAGGSITREFTYTASCTAVSGDNTSEITFQGCTGTTCTTYPKLIQLRPFNVLPGAITLTKMATDIKKAGSGSFTPITPTSEPQAAIGDIVRWRIRVNSSGLGAVKNVEITETLGSGLTFTGGFTSPRVFNSGTHPALADIANGSYVDITVDTNVVSCQNLTNNAEGKWGCGASYCLIPVTAQSSVNLIIGTPLLDFTPVDATFSVPYCSTTSVVQDNDLSFSITNTGDGEARNVSINVDFGLLAVSNISPAGVTYSGGAFHIPNIPPAPGPGNSITITYDLTYTPPVDWCAAGAGAGGGTFTWEPIYFDACNIQYYPTLASNTYTINSSSGPEPTISISKSCSIGGTPIGLITPLDDAAQTVNCTITVNYSFPATCTQGNPFTVTDTYPTEWTASTIVTPSGSTINTGAHTITWSIPAGTMSGAGTLTYNQNFTIPKMDSTVCPACGTQWTNTVQITGNDCCGCGMTANASISTTVECPTPELGISSSRNISGSGAEVCNDTMSFTSTYTFTGAGWNTVNWQKAGGAPNVRFTEQMGNRLELLVGSPTITVTGSTGTPTASVTSTAPTAGADGTLSIEFTGNFAIKENAVLTIQYNLRPTTHSQPQCGSSHSFIDFADLEVFDTSAVGGGVYCPGASGGFLVKDANQIDNSGSKMTVSITGMPAIVSPCGEYTPTVTVTKTSAEPAYDVVLVLDTTNYEVIEVTSATGITPANTKDGETLTGKGRVWNYADLFSGGANQTATLNLKVQGRCLTNADLKAELYYNDGCGNIENPEPAYTPTPSNGRSCSDNATASGIIRNPQISVSKFPEVFYADAVQGQSGYTPAEWTITVINSGSGDAFNVEVIEELGNDLCYPVGCGKTPPVPVLPTLIAEWDDPATPGDESSGIIRNVVSPHEVHYTIPQLGAGKKLKLKFQADITGCEFATNTVSARIHCLSKNCCPPYNVTPEVCPSDTSVVYFPPTDLSVTTKFVNPGNSCVIKSVYMTVKNAGLTPIRDITLNEILPDDLKLQINTAEYRINPANPDIYTSPAWSRSFSPPEPAEPTGSGTTLNPYKWAYNNGTLPVGLTSKLAILQPGEIIQVRFDGFVGCDFEPGQIRFYASFNECGSAGEKTTSESIFNVIPNKPILTVTKTADKSSVTCGNVKWNLTIKNEAIGTAGQPVTAEYILLKDIWGTGFNSLSGTPVLKDSGGTLISPAPIPAGANAFQWELLGLNPGNSVTYTMEATLDKCDGTFDNTLIAKSGCYDSVHSIPKCFICEEKGTTGTFPYTFPYKYCPQITTTVTNEVQKLDIDLVNPNVNACSDDQTIQVRLTNNSDLVAISNPSVDIELPSGVTYLATPAPSVSPASGSFAVSQSGQTLTFTGLPTIPAKNGGAAQSDIITFHVSVACDMNGDIQATPHYNNCCGTSGTPVKRIVPTNWQSPILDVDVTNTGGPYECGAEVTWTVSVTNNGPVAAEMVRMSDVVGSGLSFLNGVAAPNNLDFYKTATGDTLFDWNAGTRTLTWEIGNLAANGGTRTYTLKTSMGAGASCTNPLNRRNTVDATWHCVTGGFADGNPTGISEGTCESDPSTDASDAAVNPTASATANISGNVDYCDKTKDVTLTITNPGTSSTLFNLTAEITLPANLKFASPTSFTATSTNPVVWPDNTTGTSYSAYPEPPVGSTSYTLSVAKSVPKNTDVVLTFKVSSSCFSGGDIEAYIRYDDCCNNHYGPSPPDPPSTIQNVLPDNPVLDIAVSKNPAGVPSKGQDVDYTITVTNNSTARATYTQISAHLGKWLKFVSAAAPGVTLGGTPGGGTSSGVKCDDDGAGACDDCTLYPDFTEGTLYWDIKDFEGGAIWTTVVRLKLDPPASGTDCNNDYTKLDVYTKFDCPDDIAGWAFDNNSCTNETGGGCTLKGGDHKPDSLTYCASLGDLVWYDLNGDGIQNETTLVGIQGVEVDLYDGDGNPVKDNLGNSVKAITDVDGKYLFNNLIPGNYYVKFIPLAGYLITQKDAGGDDATDSDIYDNPAIAATYGLTDVTTLDPDEDDMTWDAGMYQLDFGDLPEDATHTYGTTLAKSGARHILDPAKANRMGASVDNEADGQPGINADGDDKNGTTPDDEDGVTFLTPIMPGQTYQIKVNNATGSTAYLNAWIDFNGNGTFDTGEKISADGSTPLTDYALNPGDNILTLKAPASAVPFGTTLYSRFRVTKNIGEGGDSPTGIAYSGEVEDYALMSLGDVIWNDNGLGGGAANNGIKDGTEPGIAGVTVELLNNTDTVIATTTTDSSGKYLFTGLNPTAIYKVNIPASQFAAGGALNNYIPSSVAPSTLHNETTHADKNAGTNDAALGGVSSPSITMTALGGEQTNSIDTDANSDKAVDFGFYAPVNLGNLVWHDANGNGQKDTGETGIDGVPVRLFYEGDNPLTATPVAATTTSGGGIYNFTNLIPGRYFVYIPANASALSPYPASSDVTVTDTADNDEDNDDNGSQSSVGGAVSSPVVSLASGAESTSDGDGNNGNLTVDFGFYAPVSIGNLVWADLNNNGIADSGENGFDGVRVELYREGQIPGAPGVTPVAAMDTSGGGFYKFGNLSPGRYFVYIPTPPPDHLASSSAIVTDTDDNGEDHDDNGIQSVAGAPTRSPIITLTSRGEWDTAIDGDDINGDMTVDFGFYHCIAIGNFVWADSNVNGIQDAGEIGIPGVTVRLFDKDGNPVFDGKGNPVNPATTDADGYYQFEGIAPGQYYVQFDKPTGYSPSPAHQGSDESKDSDADPTSGKTPILTLTSTGDHTIWDAGFWTPLSLGDYVWYDKNANGVQDADETGISGITVKLFKTSDNGATLISATDTSGNPVADVTTDSNGKYLFTNLPAGDYVVEMVPPSGYTLTTGGADPDNDDNTDSNGYLTGSRILSHPITLLAATEPITDGDTNSSSNLTVDFGLYKPMSLGNFVWADSNGNGIQDSGEPGIAGVSVQIFATTDDGATLTPATDITGNPVSATTTDTNGLYNFGNLPPGDYVVQLTPPADYFLTSGGTDPDDNSNSDSNGYPKDDKVFSLPVTLSSDDEPTTDGDLDSNSNMTIDFGFYKPVSLGNFIFFDTNKDGIQDAGEPGLSGATVQLFSTADDGTTLIPATDINGNAIASITTGSDGLYNFTNLRPGNYVVQVTPPAGYAPTIGGNDPDDDSNTDSNGYLNGGAVQSHPVMLEFGKEPINDGDTDADSNLSVDFGFIKQYSASLGDLVWYDINKNGIQDASEPGIAGVTVNLLDAANNVLETMTTDGSGNYLFDDLEPGTYSVEFVKPAGYDITLKSQGADTARDSDADLTTGRSPQITLGENEHNPKIDAGMYIPNTLPASLGDYVWYDENADGIQDSSEIGVAGVTVNLYNAAGVVISTTTTTGTGYYQFTGLAPGSYSVEFVKPSGYTFTPKTQGGDSAFDSDADTTTGKTASVILAAGEHNPKIDAGLFMPSANPASLGDTVWYDVNKNGIQDVGETGVPGVTVNLLDVSGNIIRTTTTDTSGYYLFANLTPGTYSVEFVKPAGYELTLKTQGSDSAKDSDADTTSGKTAAVTLAAGEHNPKIDAGLYQPDIASLGDFVWYDTDNDGIQDAGEPGIAGVVVKLYNSAGQNIGVTQTYGTGYYEFTDLAPGTYSVEFVKPNADYTFSPKSQGTQNGLDSDADTTTGKTAQVTLAGGENNPRIDAGMFIPGTLPSSLGDRVWYDTDKDGIQDAGENGISGVTVTLKTSSGQLIATTTTDGSGNYLFSGLAAGDYVVTFTPPSGYSLTLMAQGGDTAKDSDAGITGSTGVITLGKGEHNPNIDAGMYSDSPPASLGDYVWLDTDKNGIQDAGETGVTGVTVRLLDAAGDVIATTTTDSNGYYHFTGLAPGAYSVEFVKPDGYAFSPKDQGSGALQDNFDSDADINTGKTAHITLSAGENDLSIDAGLYIPGGLPASLGDYVWFDTDKDGIQDADETGIAGITVTLRNAAGDIIATTQTDGSGYYLFDGLVPGDYAVGFTPLTGYHFSPQTQGGDSAKDSNPDTATGLTAVVHLNSGEHDPTIDAGLYADVPPASLGDYVWYDTDKDGIQDSGETGMSGVTVTLYDKTGTVVIAATQTDVNGYYEFAGLIPGDYTVGFGLSGGYSFSPKTQGSDTAKDSNADTVTGRTAIVHLNPGDHNPTIDAGIYAQNPIRLGDLVWLDSNSDGQPSSGEGIVGVTLNLYDGSGNLIATTVTDTNGKYEFPNLPHGNYRVVVDTDTLPSGITPLYDADGVLDSRTDALNQTSDNPNLDFGYMRGGFAASLGDVVWYDDNKNGIQDTGESGVPGVTVKLYNAAGTVVDTTITDSTGYYLFDNLAPGSYSVEFVKPAGYTFTAKSQGGDSAKDSNADTGTGKTAEITLSAGEHNPTIDAGLYISSGSLASLGDYVWYDVNKNGIQDIGETGVAGVTVNLLDNAGNIIKTTATDSSGYYLFANLTPGTYSVEFVKPSGYELTLKTQGGDSAKDSDADTTTGITAAVTLAAGEHNPRIDAGLYQPDIASLGDFVWYDTDNDGIQDTGEPGIAGVVVKLYNAAGQNIGVTQTEGRGYYEFTDLAPGTYSVEFVKPDADYTFSPKSQGTQNGLDSDADTTTGKTAQITLSAGENNPRIDAGMFIPGTLPSSLGDRVWYDTDKDGIQDAGENGISGVTVTLKTSSGQLVATTTTDGSGNYLFSGLAAGDYVVTFTPPSGYSLTLMAQGGDTAKDSDAGITGSTGVITLGKGEHNPNIDAGMYSDSPPASLGDYVWLDTDKNGIQDAGETGVTGVTVRLLDAAGDVIATASTDSSGYYHFTGLAPGAYSVEFVKPDGYTFSPKDQGSGALQDNFDSDADTNTGRTSQITLSAGENDLSIDAGLYIPGGLPASLGDYVWYDDNKNGIQDSGETGVAGVTVTLRNAAGDIIATTQTDGSGYYLFDGLVPGDYVVGFTPLSGYHFSPQTQGGDSAKDSNPDTATGLTAVVHLNSGEHNPTIDAGLYADVPPASLGDYVWYDTDKDGIQDSGENGVSGVTVTLYDKTGTVVIAATQTDVNGYYEFAGLIPGDYTVGFGLPGGYSFSPKTQGSDTAKDSNADTVTGRTAIVHLNPGDHNPTIDAGIYADKTIKLGDLVWLDTNNDGKPSSGEGIVGVTLNLYDGSGHLIATTITDLNGKYEFPNLPPGDYRVVVDTDSLPDGVTPMSDADGVLDSRTDALNQTSDNPNLDFGYMKGGVAASLGDIVWYDADADGVQDSGEAGVLGVVVNLYNAAGNLIATAITDNTGYYSFDNLAPGSYSVGFVRPDGYSFSPKTQGGDSAKDSNADTATGKTAMITLSAGEHNPTIDAGLFMPSANSASLGDVVWFDTDHNGIQNPGEPGIAGITVHLLNASGIVISTTVTDGTGYYEFTGLAPGSYAVEFVKPSDTYSFSPQAQGSSTSADSDANTSTGRTSLITLGAGEHNPKIDAGMYIPNTIPASLGNFVWYDSNHNGIQEQGELGIAGVTVHLLDASGKTVATTVTDGTGFYQFTGLIPGQYSVEFVKPDTYIFSPKAMGYGDLKDAFDSDADATTGKTGIITLSGGENNPKIDAGLYIPGTDFASISDKIWYDVNQDGIQDPGEPGIPGVSVKLYDENGRLIATIKTDSAGFYIFSGLPRGDYIIEVEPPEGYSFSPKNAGSDSGRDSDVNSSSGRTVVTILASGERTIKIDAGLYSRTQLASLGNYVWYDSNRNGIQDADETGISGITVNLYDKTGTTIVATTVTDADGHYSFNSLLPGDYLVGFGLPGGYVFSPQSQGADIGADSNANPNTGLTSVITLKAGENNPSIDAGVYVPNPIRLGDLVFWDKNNDGKPSPGEGIPNVTLNLYDSNGNLIGTTRTDADGHYEFPNLPPGDYRITVDTTTLPSDVKPLSDPDGVLNSSSDVKNQNTDNPNLDFGYHVPVIQPGGGTPGGTSCSISNFVWVDNNHNGIQDAGEPGVPGVRVNLYAPDGSFLATTVTDENGYYIFDNLMPGTYIVGFELPPGYEFTLPNQGSNDSTDSDADTITGRTPPITVGPGEHNTTVDAGLLPDDKITIGDLVWVDKNGDGVPSPGEGIPGVTIILLDGDGNVIDTTVTDDDGHYHFTDLEPGDYTVVVDTDTLPDGVIPLKDPDGVLDSETDLPNLNDDNPNVDFGYTPEPDNKPDLTGTTKSVADINGGLLEPGDILMYAIVIYNSGDKPAQAVVYTDTPSPYTTLVPGSLTATQGTISETGGQIRVSIGDIPAKASVIIRYQVKVNTGVADGTLISNQGVLTGKNIPDTPTDFPDTPAPDDATTVVVGKPQADVNIDASKTASVVGGGDLAPGGQISYQITISNSGTSAAKDVSFSDTIPFHTTLVPGSISTTQGTVLGGSDVSVSVGTLGAGQTVNIAFTVTVDADADDGTVITNQGVVKHDGDKTKPTDDTVTPIPDNTPDPDKPDVVVYKTIQDVNGGTIERGDILEYTVRIINPNKTGLENVAFYDNPAGFSVFSPADSYYARLIPNTVSNTHGQVITGNGSEDRIVKVDVGNLNPNEIVEIHFQVEVSEYVSDGTTILNQGTVTVDGRFAKFTDDPYTLIQDDPTQVTVIHVNNGLGIRGIKTVSGTKPNLRWELHWYNDNNDSVSVHIEDPLATGMSYLSGKADFGLFRYDEINRKIVWDGYIPAGKELGISFETTVDKGVTHLENQAYLWWDKNKNGDWKDDTGNPISSTLAVWEDTPAGKCRLSLGDYVWIRNQQQCDDNGSVKPGWGSSRDSVITDTGINSVKINLYRDTDHNNKFTPGKDEFMASAISKNGPDGRPGYYRFDNLCEDDYIVQIDPANFLCPGGILAGYLSLGEATDPDNDINSDNNGYSVPGFGVLSDAVTLRSGTEPVNDGDSDADTNLSVDFGFVPESPCKSCCSEIPATLKP